MLNQLSEEDFKFLRMLKIGIALTLIAFVSHGVAFNYPEVWPLTRYPMFSGRVLPICSPIVSLQLIAWDENTHCYAIEPNLLYNHLKLSYEYTLAIRVITKALKKFPGYSDRILTKVLYILPDLKIQHLEVNLLLWYVNPFEFVDTFRTNQPNEIIHVGTIGKSVNLTNTVRLPKRLDCNYVVQYPDLIAYE